MTLATIKTKAIDVPRLRFPGFHDPWPRRRLGDLLVKIVSGVSPSSFSLNNDSQGIPYLKVEDLNNSDKYQESSRTYVGNTLRGNVPQGSIIFPKRGAAIMTNKVRICAKDSFMDSNLMAIIADPNEAGSLFLYYLIHKEGLFKIADTSTIPQINNKHIVPYMLLVPDIQEQQKIAEFLTAVDDKITALQQKVDLLKKYKKGAARAVFTQKFRFKDENNQLYPDWEDKRFGDLYVFLRTNSFSRAELTSVGNIKNIHYGDVHTKLPSNFRAAAEKLPFLVGEPNSDLCNNGDLIIADASEDTKDVGKALEIIDTNGDEIVAGLHTFLARPKERIAPGFSAYLMQADAARKQLVQIATGASVLGISKTSLSKLQFRMPVFEEQQKIADFLTAIDAKINLTEKELEQAKRFKKALLQQMFV